MQIILYIRTLTPPVVYTAELSAQLGGDLILPRVGDKIITNNPNLPTQPNVLALVKDVIWVLDENKILLKAQEVQSFD